MSVALARPAIGQYVTVHYAHRPWPAVVTALCGDTVLVRFTDAPPVIAGQALDWNWFPLADCSWTRGPLTGKR